MFNGVLFNPAYCGSQRALNITALYRTQWTGIDGAPVASSFSAHSPLKNRKMNVGLIAENERLGLFDRTRVNILYAYRVRLGRGHLGLGLSAGYAAFNSNWNRIVTVDSDDPSFSQGIPRQSALTAGTGIYFQSSAFYAGLSCPSILTNNHLVQNSRVFVLNSGFLTELSDDFKLKPAVLIMYLHSLSPLVNVSGTFYYRELLGVGIGYSYQSSLNVIFDLRVNDQLRVGYAYDYAAGALRKYTAGSHEIMLRYVFSFKVKAVNARYF